MEAEIAKLALGFLQRPRTAGGPMHDYTERQAMDAVIYALNVDAGLVEPPGAPKKPTTKK